mmetsp:Transcript_42766/g.100255  ORF Transcript_42766/g.100255 Transcript_42766/m.100255 type:complete len:84 (-) Transcript_42766:69-320(-)
MPWHIALQQREGRDASALAVGQERDDGIIQPTRRQALMRAPSAISRDRHKTMRNVQQQWIVLFRCSESQRRKGTEDGRHLSLR